MKTALIAVMALGWVTTASALRFEPGLWQVDMVSQNPMMGERRTSRTECVSDGDYDPVKDFQQDAQCRILDHEETATQLHWRMECGPEEGPKMIGEGEFLSKGKTASGRMLMKMSFAGQSMVMSNHWTGRHVGACP